MERKIRSILLVLLLAALTLALTGCIPGLFGPKDTDKDGIPDKYDLCPTQPGSAQYGGCPPPTPSLDVTGNWQGDLVDATNVRFELRLSLQQSGSSLIGTLWLENHSHTISSGTVNESTGQVVIQFTYWRNAQTLVLRGVVQGNRMAGKWENLTVAPGTDMGEWEVFKMM